MHAGDTAADKVPRFVRTLYEILQNEDVRILSWSADGSHFQVYDVARLERELLPKYFKHNNFSSFQRQLNNFGFRKWTKSRTSVCTFSHEFLHRCPPSRLNALVTEMEVAKAAIYDAASHIGTKRPRSKSFTDKYTASKLLKGLSVKNKQGTECEQEEEHEPEQEMASFGAEYPDGVSWALNGLNTTDLSSLDWSLVTDSRRADELNELIEPLLSESVETPDLSTATNQDDSSGETAMQCLPPLDLDFLGDSWTDIFDGVNPS